MNKNIIIWIWFFLILSSSCSTNKKTYFNRKYHDVTAKYNGYFNGKESFKKVIIKLENSYEENYLEILPVFKTSHVLLEKTHYSYMDKAIQKASVVIQKHSIKIKDQEYCKWIDDSYLLIAKSYFYKGDFAEAKNTFKYIVENFKNTEAAYESVLWIARCNIENLEYKSAELILNDLKFDQEFPEKLHKQRYLIYSDLFLRQNKYLAASDELILACDLIKRNSKKARYYYILGQIYQKYNNQERSKEYYQLAIKGSLNYEMVFNANMNLATSMTDKKDALEMRDKLAKMIKDEKNKDYLDQIYYTLAEMDLISLDTQSAIENYKLSTINSLENNNQKGISFLAMSEILYDQNRYNESKIYYDSAYFFISQSHPRYQHIYKRKNTLEELVYHLNIISLEDSLQILGRMSDLEKKQAIQNIINKIIEKEQEEALKKQNREGSEFIGGGNRRNNFNNNNSFSGKWYFYNPTTLSFGMSEFKKKWGKRKLEDNWRRSNKKDNSFLEGDTLEAMSLKKSSSNNVKSEEYYMSQIPNSEEMFQVSNKKIITSLYQSSLIYKQQMDKPKMSKKMFWEIIKRFPKNIEYTPLAYYSLYKLNQELNQEDDAETVKKELIKNFPNSDYTKFLLNPDYMQRAVNKNKKEQEDYNVAYQLYKEKEYQKSYNISFERLENDSLSYFYDSRYYFINMMSEFKLNQDTTKTINKINFALEKYKSKDIIADFLFVKNTLNNPNNLFRRNEIAENKTFYTYKEHSTHYIVVLTPKELTDAIMLKTAVSDFNRKEYSGDVFEINSVLLGMDQHLLIIKTFSNVNQSKKYYKRIFENQDVVSEIPKQNHKKFIISEENFIEFYKYKDIDGYAKFFSNNYLN